MDPHVPMPLEIGGPVGQMQSVNVRQWCPAWQQSFSVTQVIAFTVNSALLQNDLQFGHYLQSATLHT